MSTEGVTLSGASVKDWCNCKHIHAYMNLSGKRTEKAICSIYYTSIYKYIYLYISQYNLKVMYSIQAEKLVSFP